jgi:hypothetical protein
MEGGVGGSGILGRFEHAEPESPILLSPADSLAATSTHRRYPPTEDSGYSITFDENKPFGDLALSLTSRCSPRLCCVVVLFC